MKRTRAIRRRIKTNQRLMIGGIERQIPPSGGQGASVLEVAKGIHTQNQQESGKVFSVYEANGESVGKVCVFPLQEAPS